jgi:hypothetical protein
MVLADGLCTRSPTEFWGIGQPLAGKVGAEPIEPDKAPNPELSTARGTEFDLPPLALENAIVPISENKSISPNATLADRCPLSALFSQTLVAFTLEVDYEFERRMENAGFPGTILSRLVW